MAKTEERTIIGILAVVVVASIICTIIAGITVNMHTKHDGPPEHKILQILIKHI